MGELKISIVMMNKIEKNNFQKDSKDAALKYLEYRDRTCCEMRQYLDSKKYCTEDINETIEYLIDMGYLCDESYIDKYIDYGISKGKGLFKIKHELMQKGIDSDLINEGLDNCEKLNVQNEKNRAMIQVNKILGNVEIKSTNDCYEFGSDDEYKLKAEKYKEQQRVKSKVARRLNSLGYSRSIIFDIINEIFNSEDDFVI